MNKGERQYRGTIASAHGCVIVHRFDSHYEFCDAGYMKLITRKLIATILIMWMPLFAGNALAASCGDCDESQQIVSNIHDTHKAAPMSHAAQPGYMAQCGHQLDHKVCGLCSFNCAGYISMASIEVASVDALSMRIAPVPVRFQSAAYVPLLPPPVTRV